MTNFMLKPLIRSASYSHLLLSVGSYTYKTRLRQPLFLKKFVTLIAESGSTRLQHQSEKEEQSFNEKGDKYEC